MNPVPLFLIIVTLPLLLGGCDRLSMIGKEPVTETKPELEGVNYFELEERKGITYIKGSYSPYTGKAYKFYENGHKQVETNIKDGKRDGPETQWHENGQKQFEINLKDGKPEGLATWWSENGQKEKEINYEDGKYEGLGTFWHENGQKQVEANFKDGKLISGKYWNSKGEPVATAEESRK